MFIRKFATKFATVVAIASTFLLFGCSSSNSPSDPNAGNQTSTPGPGTNTGGNTVTEFDGNWTRACINNVGGSGYSVANLTITGSTRVDTTYSYRDQDCTVPGGPVDLPGSAAVSVYSYSLVYPGGSTSTTLGAAKHVDVTLESIEYDGAPATADQLGLLQWLGAFNTDHTLQLVANDRLYLADDTGELDGTSADLRPRTIDATYVLVRQ